MNKGVLREIPNTPGPAQQFTTFDAAEGYQCWLKGADAKPHVSSWPWCISVHESGTQSRLELLLPRATESSLKLLVPLEKAEGSLKSGNEGIVRRNPAAAARAKWK